MSRVDAVVVAYRSGEHLRSAVEGLVRLPDTRVIVVDNECPEQSYLTVSDLDVEVVHTGRNGGFAAGCNAGIAAGSSPEVLLLNPDAVIGAVALGRLRDALAANPDAGIAAPRIVGDDGELHWSLRRFPRVSTTFAQALYLHRVAPYATWTDELIRDPERYVTPGDVEWASGAALLVRRPLLERLGGLDEGFFLYCEDMDLCRRAWDAGARVIYEPRAVAVHAGGGSGARGPLLPVLARSRMRYARLHRGRTAGALERAGIAVGALTHLAPALVRPDVARGQMRTFTACFVRRPASGR